MKSDTKLLLFITGCFAAYFALPFVVIFCREIDWITLTTAWQKVIGFTLVAVALILIVRKEINRYPK